MQNQCNRISKQHKRFVNGFCRPITLDPKNEQFKSEKRMKLNNVTFDFRYALCLDTIQHL